MNEAISGDRSTPEASWASLHRHHLLIVLCTLIVHGLLLFNDGVYYDGWLARTFVEFGHRDRLQRWFIDSGVPQVYYMHLWLGALPGGVFTYKLIGFLCIAFSGLLTYSIAHESGLVNRLESLLITLVAICYPAFQASPEITILPFVICYTLFLLGVLLALRSEPAHNDNSTPKRLRLLAFVACACFFLSFTIPSLLVFYAGFLWLFATVAMQRRGWDWRLSWREFARARWYLVLLPVAFWIFKKLLLPTRGFYAEYNEFKLNAYSLIYNFRTFLASSIYDQFNAALSHINQPVQWLLLLLAAQSIYLLFCLARRGFSDSATSVKARLKFGFILLLLGIVPYVLVGKAPDAAGFGTRHALLVGLPIAILLIALIQLLFPAGNHSNDDKREHTVSNIGWVIMVSLLMLFSLTIVNSYVGWQARWVKCRAVMQALQQDASSAEYSTYWIYDEFDVGTRHMWTVGEWSSLFKTVWRDESRVGIDVKDPTMLHILSDSHMVSSPIVKGHYNFTDWNARGRHANLSIKRGPAAASNARVVAYYYLHKFIRPAGMTAFLQQVATVRVAPAVKHRALPLP